MKRPKTSGSPRRLAAGTTLVALGAVMALSAALPTPASAQGSGPQIPRLVFVSQTPWAGAGSEFALRFRVDRPPGPSNLEVAISIYPAVATRSEFAGTLQDKVFGQPVMPTAVFPLGALPTEAGGDMTVTVPLDLGRRPAGVMPVRLVLRARDDGSVLDRLNTHLVYLPDPVEGPKLGVSFVLPVHELPGLQPDGTRKLADGEDLTSLAQGIDAARALPVSLVPTPETVSALVASDDSQAGTVLNVVAGCGGRPPAARRLVRADQPARPEGGRPRRGGGRPAGAGPVHPHRGAAGPALIRCTWVAQQPLDAGHARPPGQPGHRPGGGDRRRRGLTPIPDQLVTLTRPFRLAGRASRCRGRRPTPAWPPTSTAATRPYGPPSCWPTWPSSTLTSPTSAGASSPSPPGTGA